MRGSCERFLESPIAVHGPPTFLLALLVSCFAADACRNFSYDCSSAHIVLHLLYTSAVKGGTFVVTCCRSFHVSFFTGKEKKETDFKLKERVFILSTSILCLVPSAV